MKSLTIVERRLLDIATNQKRWHSLHPSHIKQARKLKVLGLIFLKVKDVAGTNKYNRRHREYYYKYKSRKRAK